MIQQPLDLIAAAITSRLPATLASMPGVAQSGLDVTADITVTREMVDEQLYKDTAIGVRIEQQDAVTLAWPIEAQDEMTTLQVGVTCWLWRRGLVSLTAVTDDQMCRAVRALCRAVDYAIRAEFAPAGALELDGVQVRCPSQVTYGEPEAGDDADLTTMTLSLSVPVLDHWALSAGSL